MSEDHVQVEEVIVRERALNGDHDLGKRIVESYDVDGLVNRGFGTVHTEAFDHVRDITDPRDFDPGTHLATIVFDVAEKSYQINWKVCLGPLQRIEDYRRRQRQEDLRL